MAGGAMAARMLSAEELAFHGQRVAVRGELLR